MLTTARAEAAFPVLAPENLPPGWRPIRVAWARQGAPSLNGEASPRNLWELGFLTPGDVYIGLNQGDAEPEDLVDGQSRKGVADGESEVAGQAWQRLVSPDGWTRRWSGGVRSGHGGHG